MIFYHGKRRWKDSLEFADLFQVPSEYYKKYIPKFEHILHEVPEVNKQKLKSTITLKVFHQVLEYIFYPEKRDKIYEAFELLFQGLNSKDAEEIFRVLIRYLLSATDEEPENAEEKVKHLPKGGETVRTTAEKLRNEGRLEGLRETIELGITLKFPGDIDTVMAKVNKIDDLVALKEIKEAIKTAQDISEILALTK